MSDELKVCPFCGGDARIHSKVLAEGFDSGYWAVCDECGKGDTLSHESEEDAAAAWNARAAVADEQLAMAVHDGRAWQAVRECKLEECEWGNGQCTWGCRCTACGDKFEHTSGITWNFFPNCGAKVVG